MNEMNQISLAPGDKYDKQCGEVFLTQSGCIIFHCTLCDCKYKGIHQYASHIIDKHFEPANEENEDDCISTFSSDLEIKEEFLDDYDEALQEEEVLIADIKEKKYASVGQVITSVPIFDENEDCLTIQWEETPPIENEIRHAKKRKIVQPLPSLKELLKTPANAQKTSTEAEKLRMANEEALIKNAGQPIYKQPIARGDIPDSERKHRCNFCGFAFKDPSNLLAHIRRHSDKRNFQCAYCPKMFCTRHEIDEHSRRHTGERPYVCDINECGRAFFTRSELNVHVKRHLNLRNYKCEVCDRSFYDKSDLKEHMVSHTQERNFECLVCNGKFSRRKALVNHMKLHENKREYECELCGACFNQRPGLNSHMRSKHKQKF